MRSRDSDNYKTDIPTSRVVDTSYRNGCIDQVVMVLWFSTKQRMDGGQNGLS